MLLTLILLPLWGVAGTKRARSQLSDLAVCSLVSGFNFAQLAAIRAICGFNHSLIARRFYAHYTDAELGESDLDRDAKTDISVYDQRARHGAGRWHGRGLFWRRRGWNITAAPASCVAATTAASTTTSTTATSATTSGLDGDD